MSKKHTAGGACRSPPPAAWKGRFQGGRQSDSERPDTRRGAVWRGARAAGAQPGGGSSVIPPGGPSAQAPPFPPRGCRSPWGGAAGLGPHAADITWVPLSSGSGQIRVVVLETSGGEGRAAVCRDLPGSGEGAW